MVKARIEVPKGSKVKYEIGENGTLYVDRVLHSSVVFPQNYGYCLNTLAEDNDPLDIIVLMQEPVFPTAVVEARPISIMYMQDGDERDDKVIAVASCDPKCVNIQGPKDLNKHTINEIKQFFRDYKRLEGKNVEVHDKLGSKKDAERRIQDTVQKS